MNYNLIGKYGTERFMTERFPIRIQYMYLHTFSMSHFYSVNARTSTERVSTVNTKYQLLS